MTAEEAQTILKQILPPDSLNSLTLLVFEKSWGGKTYAKISNETGYDNDYIREVAAKLWKSLSEALGQKVTKKNCQTVLVAYQNSQQANFHEQYPKPAEMWKSVSEVIGQKVTKQNYHSLITQYDRSQTSTQGKISTKPATKLDWGTAPDLSVFYGRQGELAKLEQYIVGDRCRLVALLGLGGMGKTALSVKLAQQLQGKFDYLIWRTLRNAPMLEEILEELVAILSNQEQTKASPRQLLSLLRQRRALIVLDNLETILQPGKTGYYRPGYEDYGDLFRILGETAHSSCLLLTSREKPPEVAAFEGMDGTVRSFHLSGSPEAAQAILQARGIRGTDAQKQQLAEYYGYSPLGLKIVATSIQDLFDGDLDPFLQEGNVALNGIRRLLEQQFDRLTPIEESILVWLAINREWTSIAELEQDLIPRVPKFSLVRSLESLTWRSLVEKKSGRYTLQPVVMEYITDNLIGQIYEELMKVQPDRFNCYALTKTTVKDYVRESQSRLILEPIAHLLGNSFSSAQALEEHVQSILEVLRLKPTIQKPGFSDNMTMAAIELPETQLLDRGTPIQHPSWKVWRDGNRHRQLSAKSKIQNPTPSGYGTGNLINLCTHLDIDLRGYDFSHLPIWHADFSRVNLHGVNLAHADCARSVFTQSVGGILQVAYSPDGQLFATGDTDGILRLWRTHDTQPQTAFLAHSSWLISLAFSPDGRYLATGGDDGVVRLWNLETGQCCQTLPLDGYYVWSLAFSPDGKQLAIGCSESEPYLWEIGTEQLTSLTGHSRGVNAVRFSPDGQTLASASHDGTLKLWNVKTQQCWQTFQGHSSLVSAVAFSPDGQTLASGSHDRTVKFWEVSTGQCLKTATGHQDIVLSLDFHPDGHILASGSVDRTIRLWDTHRGQCRKILQGHHDMVYSIAFSPDGQTLVSGSPDQTAIFWDLPSGSQLRTLQGYINYVYSLAWNPLSPSSQLASSGTDWTVRIWDAKSHQCLQTLAGHQGWIWSIAWSPDGQTLASGSHDRTLKLWNLNNGQCHSTLQGHTSWVLGVAWSPDGQTLASGSSDRTLKLWNPNNGKCLQTLEGHEHWVLSVAWSPNGKLLASGGADCTVRLWQLDRGQCLKVFSSDRAWVFRVAWSPDSKLLAFGGDGNTLQLWDASSHKLLKTLTGHTEPVAHIAFSPDGKTIASTSFDRTVRLWDVSTGKCLHVLEDHTEAVVPVVFSGDGRILASGGEDGTIRLWDAMAGECLQTLSVPRPYEGTNITGIKGLTEAQQQSLKVLGAVQI